MRRALLLPLLLLAACNGTDRYESITEEGSPYEETWSAEQEEILRFLRESRNPDTLPDPASLHDPFRALRVEDVALPAVAEKPPTSALPTPKPVLRLEGILLGKGAAKVVIGGTLYGVGDKVGILRVERIGERLVEFSGGGGKTTLRVGAYLPRE